MIDLDGYKQLNDRFGHSIGDQLLVVVGQVIAANMRRMDIAARYGGDEFILLLPRATAVEAGAVVERIREDYRRASAAVLKRDIGVGISVGIAAMLPGRPSLPEQLIILADAALYQAKAAGRDRTMIASVEPQTAAV
jgi:diguanylate cyclase (GGDEF)-like protein